ncbi:MAG TPA: four helix bundle protein [Bacteroidales bacterium]|nr:four helix bundle protein [Bacteroidales bacterium]
MFKYSFEKLDVWQESRCFVQEIYSITSQFPDSEKYGLINQIRRAAISISSNIAEGSSRNTSKDQAHFYIMAYSSCIEIINQIILAFDLQYINDETYINTRTKLEKITNQINALKNSLSR